MLYISTGIDTSLLLTHVNGGYTDTKYRVRSKTADNVKQKAIL